MRTAIAKPIDFTTVERVDRPRRWQDIENALHYDGTYAVRVFDHGNDYQDVLFECKEIPTYAHIHEARFVARAYAESDRDTYLAAAYHIGWLEEGVRRTETQSQRLGYATLHFGSALETLSAVFPQRFLHIWRDHKSARSLFDMFIRTYTIPSEPRDGANKLFIDSLHIEFDYTTPPMPWKGSVHIQGDPMTTQKIKQGSNAPNISVSVIDATGAPLDLRGCKLSLVARSSSHEFGGEVTITDAEQGKGFYAWQENDTSVPGLYRVELVAEWLDGSRVIIPFDRYGLIEVVPSL